MKEKIKAKIKDLIPWQVRYALKIYEAKGHRIPFKYHNEYEAYTNAFYGMLSGAGIDDLEGKVVCELGVGEYFSHALLEYQMGAEHEYMLEIEDYAGLDSNAFFKEPYLLSDKFEKKRVLPRPEGNEAWREYLEKINATYMVNGLDGYKEIPDDSVDYCFSDAVFEHIRKPVFTETIREIYRFMRSGGVSYHIIDFRDHIGGGKNHLRISEDKWEDGLHYKMDNYTNRLSLSEILSILGVAGFSKIDVQKIYYDRMPLKRNQLAEEFKNISDEDLMIKVAKIKMIK